MNAEQTNSRGIDSGSISGQCGSSIDDAKTGSSNPDPRTDRIHATNSSNLRSVRKLLRGA
jgi:hypothetical protein